MANRHDLVVLTINIISCKSVEEVTDCNVATLTQGYNR